MVAMMGNPLARAAPERNPHLVKVEKGLQNQKVHTALLEQPDLFSDELPNIVCRRRSLTFKELGARDAACHQCAISCDFLSNRHRCLVDLLRLGAIARALELFAACRRR